MFASLQSPEKERALQVLMEYLPRWESLFISGPPTTVVKTGDLFFSNEPLSKLPTDSDTWVWNQSNRNVSVRLNDKQEVELQKMNARRRRGVSEPPPSYKVWIYNIGDIGQRPHLFGLWCEKGITSIGEQIEDSARAHMRKPLQSSISGPNKTSSEFLQSLSFLKPFVDETVAKELGWEEFKEDSPM